MARRAIGVGPARVVALAVALVVALVGIGAGCVSRTPVSLVSSKTLAVTRINAANLTPRGPARGEDCQHIVVLFPTSGIPTIDEALDRALEPSQANLLMNGTVTYHYFYVPYVYGRSCWTAEGEAYDVRE